MERIHYDLPVAGGKERDPEYSAKKCSMWTVHCTPIAYPLDSERKYLAFEHDLDNTVFQLSSSISVSWI